MFPYIGSKLYLAHLYPKPKYTRIIEPFAGSAGYSLTHFDRDVLLIEKYELLYKLWKWLQQCSKDDILKLPRMKLGERIEDYSFDCEEAKWLMGFIFTTSVASPRKQATEAVVIRPNKINFDLKKIADNLFKIKHWDIRLGDYTEIDNSQATWFIDPPYQVRGKDYKYNNSQIDYPSLSEWCRSRQGQVIVCESIEANWLPFRKLKTKQGKLKRKPITEAIWSNLPTDYDITQLSLLDIKTGE